MAEEQLHCGYAKDPVALIYSESTASLADLSPSPLNRYYQSAYAGCARG